MPHLHRKFLTLVLLVAAGLVSSLFPVTPDGTPQDWFRRGWQRLEAWRFKEAWPHISRAALALPQNGHYRYWHMNLAAWMGMQALATNDHATARIHFATALALKTAASTNNDMHLVALRRFAAITEEHAGYRAVTPEYVHKVQVIYILNTDLTDTTNMQGQPVACRGRVTTNQIRHLALEQELLRVYVETLSRGKLSLSFDRLAVDTTVRRAWIYVPDPVTTKYRPDFESCEPGIGTLLFAGRNKYDARFYYWYRHPLHVMPFANGASQGYVPYSFSAPVHRGSLVMPLGEEGKASTALARFPYHWVLFHEFFHNIESIVGGIKPVHAHTVVAEARRACPEWKPDLTPAWTATEYSWYRHHFHTTVPKRLEEQARKTGLWPVWRNCSWLLRQPDPTEERTFTTHAAAVGPVPPPRLRLALDTAERGHRLFRSNRAAACALFRRALVLNPCQRRALAGLAGDALARRDFAEADRLCSTLTRIFPDPAERFRYGLTFYGHQEYTRAARYFRALAAEPGRSPVYTLWAARALHAAGDSAGFQAMLAGLRDNPVFKSALCTIAAPDGKNTLSASWQPGTPGLRHPAGNLPTLWRIVPAGDGVHVRLVGEEGWLALAAGGSPAHPVLRTAPADASRDQLWRLEKISGNRARLISRSGHHLVRDPGRNGKAALLLRRSATGQGSEWELRTVEAPFSGPQSNWPAAILSAASGGALDLYGSKQDEGAVIGLWSPKNSPNQRWKIMPAREMDQVHVVSLHSGKYLAVLEKNGRLVTVQTAPGSGDAQRWRLVPATGGQGLVNVRFNRALQAPARQNGPLTLTPWSGAAAQIWKIVY